MALETIIFQQDPFIYGVKDYNSYTTGSYGGLAPPPLPNADHIINGEHGNNWDSPPSSTVALNGGASTSSPETCGGGDGFFSGGAGGYSLQQQVLVAPPHAAASRRKRRRTKSMKNKEEMENQRMTHIAVERNRRRQMNDYLAVLRSLMPPSYAQRGDQASIVGGAINFVKELEQLLQFLEAQNPADQLQPPRSGGGAATYSGLFSNFFTFPQYSTSPSVAVDAAAATTAEERRSGVADIEVTVVESHANIKLLTKRRPKQLLKLVAGFQSVYLTILHLNITAAAVDESVLYSFSVKVEDECELTTVNEIATTVHEIVGMIQQESLSSRDNPPHD
ncbi:hypothetical protein ABFX02_08G217100 [Erythranthe guttata]